MQAYGLRLFLAACVGMTLVCQARAQGPSKPGPLPLLEEDCPRYASPEFDRLLSQLKQDREALEQERRSFQARLPKGPSAEADSRDVTQLLKQTLDRLRELEVQRARRAHAPAQPAPAPAVEPRTLEIKVPLPGEAVAMEHKKTPNVDDPPKHPAPSKAPATPESPPISADPLSLGHALFRLGQFEKALKAFESVDLKSRRADERTPIQFLMASCLLHVGKTDEAVELLREAANARGDERTAGYAQWQLEMQRWQRDINERLQDIRQRRQALEK